MLNDVFDEDLDDCSADLAIAQQDWRRMATEMSVAGEREGRYVAEKQRVQHAFDVGFEIGWHAVSECAFQRGRLTALRACPYSLDTGGAQFNVDQCDQMIGMLAQCENDCTASLTNTLQSEMGVGNNNNSEGQFSLHRRKQELLTAARSAVDTAVNIA